MEKGTQAAKILANAGVSAQTLNAAINDIRKGRTADSASAENQYDALKKYTRDLTEAARRPASSIRSLAATRRSAAPSRCCRAAPRTIRC